MQFPKLVCQKDLFQLDKKIVYLNGAYMSPQLKSVSAAGHYALALKNTPTDFTPDDFFKPVTEIKRTFAQLIECDDYERIALIPSASYGLATVAKNISLSKHQNIVIPEDQFPSNYYCWKSLCDRIGAELRIVARPKLESDITEIWNRNIQDAIDDNTALVAISHVHWADGTLWDLKAIREISKNRGALLIVDGTQSIGALPFSIREIQPDALVTAGYKWLMSPYSTGLAYYGPIFDKGKPLEENWINRMESEDFKNLTNYQSDYRPKASKYSVGEQSNIIMIPMMQVALQQLIAWQPQRIQVYCSELWQSIEDDLKEINIMLPSKRAHHLVGLRLPHGIDMTKVKNAFTRDNISVSLRGDAIRVAPNVYNTTSDMKVFIAAIRSAL